MCTNLLLLYKYFFELSKNRLKTAKDCSLKNYSQFLKKATVLFEPLLQKNRVNYTSVHRIYRRDVIYSLLKPFFMVEHTFLECFF